MYLSLCTPHFVLQGVYLTLSTKHCDTERNDDETFLLVRKLRPDQHNQFFEFPVSMKIKTWIVVI